MDRNKLSKRKDSRELKCLSTVIPQIQITLSCNLNCKYCFETHRDGIIKTSTVKAILQKVVAHNLQVCSPDQPVQVYWHGGEPLLAGEEFFKNVVALEAGYNGIGFDNRIQTNGTLMTDELARLFVDNDFSVGFSLDGPQKLHDAQRLFRGSGGGSFAATMRGIERFRRFTGDQPVAVNAVITRQSLNQVYEIFEFFRDLGARVQLDIYDIRLGDFCRQSPQGPDLPSLAPSDREVGQFLIELFNLWFNDDSGRVNFSELRHEVKLALQPDTDRGDPFHKKRCDFRRLIFDPQGRAYSCDQYVNDEKTTLGGIRADSLEEIVLRKNELWEQIKLHLRRSGMEMTCGACDWGRKCGGGCLTCMKYNACLLEARRRGLPDHRWHEVPVPDTLKNIRGGTYYCEGLRTFRKHVQKSVKRVLSRE